MIKKAVVHKTFGKGTIVEKKQNYIKVQFEAFRERKTFLYPDSFEKFLTFEEPDLQKKALEELKKIQEKKEAEHEAKRLLYQQQIEEAQAPPKKSKRATAASKKTEQ
ncbi:MAG: hypothetical protein Q4F05_04945 [bacterium]|nr:hypothetical protein [bacterium]